MEAGEVVDTSPHRGDACSNSRKWDHASRSAACAARTRTSRSLNTAFDAHCGLDRYAVLPLAGSRVRLVYDGQPPVHWTGRGSGKYWTPDTRPGSGAGLPRWCHIRLVLP